MAFLIKPKTKTPGFVVFTHKELDLSACAFRQNKTIQELMKSLKNDYFFGVHIGGYYPRFELFEPIDVYFAVDSMKFFKRYIKICRRRLLKREQLPFHIPLSARNFQTDYPVSAVTNEKFFEIISVARESAIKRLTEFMDAIRKLYDLSPHARPKVLLVCREAE